MLGVKGKLSAILSQVQRRREEKTNLCLSPASTLCWVDSGLALVYAGGEQGTKQAFYREIQVKFPAYVPQHSICAGERK